MVNALCWAPWLDRPEEARLEEDINDMEEAREARGIKIWVRTARNRGYFFENENTDEVALPLARSNLESRRTQSVEVCHFRFGSTCSTYSTCFLAFCRHRAMHAAYI